jgi:hypothetical protein
MRRFLACAALTLSATAAWGAGPPAEARRESPPEALASRALSIGSVAPALELQSASGGRFVLAEALKDRAAAIVFYRGYW